MCTFCIRAVLSFITNKLRFNCIFLNSICHFGIRFIGYKTLLHILFHLDLKILGMGADKRSEPGELGRSNIVIPVVGF